MSTSVAVRLCTVDGCDRRRHARGLCSRHYNRAYYAADPERHRARARRWSQANPDRVRERNQRRDPEAMRLAQRAWYWQDRLRGIATAANAKAKRLGVAGRMTSDGLRARIAYFGGRCWICGAVDADSIDHVKPLAKGGLNIHSNIRPACLGCNAARSWEGRR